MGKLKPYAVLLILLALLVILNGRLGLATAQEPTVAPVIPAVTVVTATPVPGATATPTPDPSVVPQHGLFTISLPVSGDPAQIEVTATFISPDGVKFAVPAFWMQPEHQTCNQDCTVELIRPYGPSEWRVRFSPPVPGRWTYNVEVNEAGARQTIDGAAFTVTPSDQAGMIRVGQNRHYFAYDNGMPYFPVGSNLGWSWSGARNTAGYEDWLRQLADNGANYARLYVDVPWFIGLGWRAPVTDFASIQEDAWRLDAILATAEQYKIALQIVLVWQQGWTAYPGLPVNPPTTPGRPNTDADWGTNPHNAQLGGPFGSAGQYFSSSQGRDLFKRRLRYIVGRWGYSESVFAWEVIDQLDRVLPNNPEITVDWLREMTAYLRDTDPYQHLITAGVRDTAKLSLLDPVVLDFKEVRYYQRRPIEPAGDQALGTLAVLTPLLDNADRPTLINEFSIGPWFEPTADDPTGVHVRTTMWASALSGAGGAAASWWWDTYLFPQKLTEIYGPLAAFTRAIPWNSTNMEPVGVTLVSGEQVSYQPLRVAGYNGTFGSTTPPDLTFRLSADGVTPPISTASSYLYGVTYNAQNSHPQKYIITPPVDTTLTVNVVRTSDRAGARLVINVDGKTAAEMALSLKSTTSALSVPLSAGEHTVVLDNLGEDYLQIGSLDIAAYIAPLRTLALADRKAGIFLAWLQHRDYTWQNVAAGTEIQPITVGVRAAAMPTGLYQVELWDPFTGDVVGQENVTVTGTNQGDLTINLLPISKMLAVRAIRIAEPADIPSPTPSFTPTPRIVPTVTGTATPKTVG